MHLGGIAEADFDSALQASLQADIAGTAGVAPNRVTITRVTFTEDSPPIAVVDYTIVFAGVAAGNAAAAALEDPILINLSAQEAAVEVSYEGSKITISGSISLFGIGVWADLDSNDAVGLEVALLTDLAIAAGVAEYDVAITIVTTVQDSPPLVTAEYTVSFASKAAADAGKAALEEPTLATLGAYVSTATGESIGAAVSHAGSRVSTGVEVAPTDSPTPVPTLVPTGTPTDPPTAVPTAMPTDSPTTAANPTATPTAAPTAPPKEEEEASSAGVIAGVSVACLALGAGVGFFAFKKGAGGGKAMKGVMPQTALQDEV